MGPRLFSRGNDKMSHRSTMASAAFNGAATLQSRKFEPSYAPVRRGTPSMGPRLFSRGNLFGRNRWMAQSVAFNGAATLQSRKYGRLRVQSSAGRPSMGPRLFSRGNKKKRGSLPRSRNLQWGRDSSVAEMRRCAVRADDVWATFNGAATLQSRKWRMATGAPVTKEPSMGPRLFSRGNVGIRTKSYRRLLDLQWGRDSSVAEIRAGPAHSGRLVQSLQWGRDSSVAEICVWLPGGVCCWPSMGPRLFSRGNCGLTDGAAFAPFPSMGPRLFSRGNYGDAL